MAGSTPEDFVGLAEEIRSSTSTDPVEAVLRTDDRVLARVTDGIYRQPGSALRELISNAYDADATRVVVKTDRPRFDRIVVEDNGLGMSPEALARLVLHIGGSAKRTVGGASLNITRPDDPQCSPGGRRLIGKIGIGLFSVAQLTHEFQIITKTRGDPWRTIATVVLRQYSDEAVAVTPEYDAGLVNIWREPAEDLDTQGTSIVLTAIRPQTRETLQSIDVWGIIERGESGDGEQRLPPPVFHIGRTIAGAPSDMREQPGGKLDSVPWGPSDSPEGAFKKLVEAVWDQAEKGTPRPQLAQIFDYYLRMAWQLSLAVPLPYFEGHPFDIPFDSEARVFELPSGLNEPAVEVELAEGVSLRQRLDLGSSVTAPQSFEVLLDELSLAHPLKFVGLPATRHAVTKPLMFAGRYHQQFPDVPIELSGGPLEFQAYLLWTPKVVPTEHQGVLVRIHGASGTLFDPTFLRYQVSEQTRLRQITCEIFVTAGLEGALNIDRESFNYAHPHFVVITKWLHSALRRVVTTQKRIAAEARASSRAAASQAAQAQLDEIVDAVWQEELDDEGAQAPQVDFVTDPDQPDHAGAYGFSRGVIFGAESSSNMTRAQKRTERKLRAIVQILAAHELLDHLSRLEQDRLLAALRRVLDAPDA